MPYINVDEAYILDNTGLQVDQVVDLPYTDAALTDGQKAQARKNIAAGGTNPNLLDNPWFTVNQRNISSGSGISTNTYLVDRWNYSYGSGGCAWDWDANGIKIAPVNSTSHAILKQPLESSLYNFLNGKVVTVSIMLQDGTIYSGSNTVALSTTVSFISVDGTKLRVFLNTNENLAIDCYYQQYAIRAVKLELGSVSTLANDTPPNYADELAKCQYYFERISAGTANLTIGTGIGTGSYFYTPIKLHPKRTAPTVTYSGSVGIGRSAYETDISAIYTSGCSSDPNSGTYTLAVTVTNTTQTAYRLIIKTGGYIDFSADL